ncbi:LacI family DNA-binding transcriptional regulator [Plantibacter sp. 2H11-2]|uniref:LacI family DNA-binding transcriptional regulator n=1 Tax=Plantibacter sp. 2H11-2 TaxID=3414431 RepID=UPI003CF1606F
MSPAKEGNAREVAVERVAAGESVEEVALRFNIAPDKLRRWSGLAPVTPDTSTVDKPRPRSGQATILDLAERTGLSKSVVSRALRGQYGVSADAQDRVARAVDELGYVSNAAAQNLSAYRTNTIGVLVRDASAAFYGEMQSALQKRGTALNQRVFITSGALDNHDERRALEDLIALRVDGLIVCSGRLPLREVERFSDRFPVVVAGRPDVNGNVSSVFGDEDEGARLLARHVVERGHRHVAVTRPPAGVAPLLRRRTQIMAEELQRLGAQSAFHDVASAKDIAETLAQIPPAVTAVMCPNDRYAAELLLALRGADRSLAITGFDGIGGLSSELIGLTTWQQPIEEIGVRAVDVLMQRISDSQAGVRHVKIPGTLRISRSTAI